MAGIKSYTSLEQSKKLAEILPLETADMYRVFENNAETRVYYGKMPTAYFVCKPCWSLAALLEIIKKLVGYSLQSLDTHTVFMNCELGDKPYNIETENYGNPIDVCYEMVMRLNELKML